MTDEKEYLSHEKLKELTKELEELSTSKRKEVAEALEQAKSLGDLRENSEYQEARAAQASLEERIAYLANVLRRAVVVDSHHSTKVEIGSTVVIQKVGAKETQKIQIVGSSEVDIISNKISNESPIGVAMMGKMKGDVFMARMAKNTAEYKIVEIE